MPNIQNYLYNMKINAHAVVKFVSYENFWWNLVLVTKIAIFLYKFRIKLQIKLSSLDKWASIVIKYT